MQEIVSSKVADYCQNHSTPADETLEAIVRFSYLNTTKPQMVSGPWQGTLLTLLSKMLQPNYIVELGTFTGYSAVCLARGLKPGGKLLAIDSDAEMIAKISTFMQTIPEAKPIQFLTGKALDIIPTLEPNIDLAFIDAKKTEYKDYYDAILPLLRPGGIILTDNILWYGKVLDHTQDKTTAALHTFNQYVSKDSRVENCILPIRDGIQLIRKL